MLSDNLKIYAVEIRDGKYYDTGNKMQYLKTVVEFALKHKELNSEFSNYLKSLNL
jgi:UTP--glucose-1-phosphate uridylyltransferase